MIKYNITLLSLYHDGMGEVPPFKEAKIWLPNTVTVWFHVMLDRTSAGANTCYNHVLD